MNTLLTIGLVIVACASSSTHAQTQLLKVATWNLAWLANQPIDTAKEVELCEAQDAKKVDLDKREPASCKKGSPYRMVGAYTQLAINARLLDFDIVGLQEVQGPEAVGLLFDGKLPGSNDPKKFIQPNTYQIAVNSEGGWQKVGIAVKQSLLIPGGVLKAMPFTPLGVPLERDRRSGLDVVVPLKSGELRVLVVHLKSACQRSPLNTNGKNQEDCAQLAKQAPILKEWIDQRIAENRPFMVLGDYNRVLAASEAHEKCPISGACGSVAFWPWLDANGLDKSPVIAPTASLQHVQGCFAASHGQLSIDHILLGGGAENGYRSGSARSNPYVDSATGKPITDKSKTRLYSDHCPVSILWQR